MKKTAIALIILLLSQTAMAVDIESVCEDEMKYGSKFSSFSDCMTYHDRRQADSNRRLKAWVDTVTTPTGKQERNETRTDSRCMRDCRANQYAYDLCERRCSY